MPTAVTPGTKQSPAHKSQRLSTSTPFLHLSDKAFLAIFEFCQDEDLHFAIPFICKRIRKLLKRLTIQESKLPTTTVDAIRIMKTHTAVEENQLWKKRCLVLMPKLKLVMNELYFSFRKLYLHIKKLQAPLYHLRFKVNDLSKLLATLQQKNVKDIREVTYMTPEMTNKTEVTPKQVFTNKINEMVEELEEVTRFTRTMLPPQSNEYGQTLKWGDQYFPEFEELIQFLKCTCVYNSETTERSDRACMVQILSPVNGNRVGFTFEVVSYKEEDNSDDDDSEDENDVYIGVRFIDFGSEATTYSKQLRICATDMVQVPTDIIFNAAMHLGIEGTTKKTTATAKMKLIHRIWYEIIFYAFEILSPCRLSERGDFPRPMKMWKTAEQIFHSENYHRSWHAISQEQQKKYLTRQNESKQMYDQKMAEFEQMSNTWYKAYCKTHNKKQNDQAGRKRSRTNRALLKK